MVEDGCGDIVLEDVEKKKQGCKCRDHKVLEMLRGDNATWNGCLAHRKNGRVVTRKR